MKKDRIIKKNLLSAVEPKKTFERFCAENDIELPPQKRDTRRVLLKTVLPCVASAAVALAVTLPFVLRDTEPAAPPYYADSTRYTIKSADMDELLAVPDVIMYDRSGEYLYSRITSFYTESGRGPLGYTVGGVLWADDISSDRPDVIVEFSYTVRLDRSFRVQNEILYADMPNKYDRNGIEFYYDYSVGDLGVGLSMYFKHGAYDYFFSSSDLEISQDILSKPDSGIPYIIDLIIK